MALRYARVTGNWADTSTWAATPTGAVGESVPGSGDTVEINTAYKSDGSGGTSAGAITVTLTGDVEVQALRLYSANSGYDATIHTASEHTITCNTYAGGSSSFAGYSAKIHGYTALTGNVNFTFTRDDATTIIIDPGPQGSDKVHDLTFNHADLVCKLGSAIDIEGNLTVTAGTFTTNSAADGSGTSYALTVAGQCSVAGTLTCNGSTVSVGSGLTNTLGMLVQTNGTLTGGTGPHTYGTFNADASGTVNVTLTSNTTTINGSYSDGIAWAMRNGVTFNNGGGDIHFTGSGNQYLYERNNTARTLGDVTVNKSGGNFQWYDGGGAHYTMASLTITAGTFNTNETDGANPRDLTVTGQCNVNGGTLTLNGSTCDFGDVAFSSGTINGNTATIDLNTGTGGGWVWYQTGGTWNHNTSTVVYKTTGKHIQSNNFYNLTIECAADTNTGVWRDMSGNTLTIANNLTVKEGQFKRDLASDTLTVDGNVTIEDGGTLGHVDQSAGAENFGSLEIQSGGTYIATSGTTTVKSRTSGGYSWYAPTTGSTFTHNNGTVKFTVEDWGGANETYVQGTNFYNLEFAADTAAMEFRYDDLTDNSGLTVLNNLTITNGKVRFNQGGDSVTVHGITKMVAGQYGNTGTAPSGTHNYGNVVIESGTWKVTSGTCNMSGIRKLGGTLA